jgi:hypothetical protein
MYGCYYQYIYPLVRSHSVHGNPAPCYAQRAFEGLFMPSNAAGPWENFTIDTRPA